MVRTEEVTLVGRERNMQGGLEVDHGRQLKRTHEEKPIEVKSRPSEGKVLATEDNMVNKFLDNLPGQEDEPMQFENMEPPDPDDPSAFLGLTEVEHIVKTQVAEASCAMDGVEIEDDIEGLETLS